jgi:hypothetical protein
MDKKIQGFFYGMRFDLIDEKMNGWGCGENFQVPFWYLFQTTACVSI